MLLFSFVNFEKGYMTMLLAHIAFCTPYVITNVYPKVKQLDDNLADVTMDLGATPFPDIDKGDHSSDQAWYLCRSTFIIYYEF